MEVDHQTDQVAGPAVDPAVVPAVDLLTQAVVAVDQDLPALMVAQIIVETLAEAHQDQVLALEAVHLSKFNSRLVTRSALKQMLTMIFLEVSQPSSQLNSSLENLKALMMSS